MSALNNRPVTDTENVYDSGSNSTSSGALSLVKIFGYMALGLLITAAVAFGFGYFFYLIVTKDPQAANRTLMFVLFAACIFQFILTFIIQFVFLKGEHSIIVPYILYTITLGFMLSTFTIFIDWRLLGMAFGITAMTFLLMTIIAIATRKSNMTGVGIAAMGLFFGAGLVALFTWIFILIWPEQFKTFYWIINFAIFGAIMLTTIFDLWRINQLCQNGAMSKNLSLYCAFNMYVDFIAIFIKIVYYLLIFSSKNR